MADEQQAPKATDQLGERVERWACGGCGWGLVAGRGERERVMDKVLAHEVEGGRGHRVRKVVDGTPGRRKD